MNRRQKLYNTRMEAKAKIRFASLTRKYFCGLDRFVSLYGANSPKRLSSLLETTGPLASLELDLAYVERRIMAAMQVPEVSH
jgi:hypothetical protein